MSSVDAMIRHPWSGLIAHVDQGTVDGRTLAVPVKPWGECWRERIPVPLIKNGAPVGVAATMSIADGKVWATGWSRDAIPDVGWPVAVDIVTGAPPELLGTGESVHITLCHWVIVGLTVGDSAWGDTRIMPVRRAGCE